VAQQLGWRCSCGNDPGLIHVSEAVADVLVTELGLSEDRHDWHDDDIRPNLTRYVTPWVGYPRTDGET
jgi:hypothetical protein